MIQLSDEQCKENVSLFVKRKILKDENSLREIAAELGTSAQMLLQFSTKESFPTPEILRAMAHMFGTTTDNILQGKF